MVWRSDSCISVKTPYGKFVVVHFKISIDMFLGFFSTLVSYDHVYVASVPSFVTTGSQRIQFSFLNIGLCDNSIPFKFSPALNRHFGCPLHLLSSKFLRDLAHLVLLLSLLPRSSAFFLMLY